MFVKETETVSLPPPNATETEASPVNKFSVNW